MILPSCNHCGQCGCVCGALPYSIGVVFSGLANRTHSRHCQLTFSSCFGSGASGVAMSPVGSDPDNRGPLSSVLLLEKGCGYAVLGREAPAVGITGSGVGATFTAVLAEDEDNCGRPVWRIASVNVSDGLGSGYTHGESLKVHYIGVTEIAPALTLQCERRPPAITAQAQGGSGASLSPIVVSSGSTPPTWGVASVAVLDGGNGYRTGDTVSFSAGSATVVTPASATVVAGGPPSNSDISTFEFAPDYSPSGGSGAQYAFTFTESGGQWILSVAVSGGGSGYTVGDILEFVKEPLGEDGLSIYAVSSVDVDGAITSIALTTAEPMGGTPGPITAVAVTQGGEYYGANDVPDSVTVQNGGRFYMENPALQAITADVTVTAPACGGTGEEIEATIGTDPTSPDFGRITHLAVTDGGENHLAWYWACTNLSELNGQQIVLVAQGPKKLVTTSIRSCFGSGACIGIVANGVRATPPLTVRPTCSSDAESSSCSGGTVTHTLAQSVGEDGLPYWSISSVSASGGTGYPDSADASIVTNCVSASGGTVITVEPASVTLTASGGALTGATINAAGKYYVQTLHEGDPTGITEISLISGGSGYAKFGREPPTLSIGQNASFASGGTFTATMADEPLLDSCKLPYWPIESIAVGGSGVNYADSQLLAITVASPQEKVHIPAVARLYTRQQPAVSAAADGPGEGATFTVSLLPTSSQPKQWSVASVSVVDGGSGYEDGVAIRFSVPVRAGDYGHYTGETAMAVGRVNGSGSITSVEVERGGGYWLNNGVPQEAVVEQPGGYYRENPDLEPLVAGVTVDILQLAPSTGTNAAISAEVDTDTASPTFGQIISASIDAQGSGYTLLGSPLDCEYSRIVCLGTTVTLALRGHGKAPRIYLDSEQGPLLVFELDDVLDDCAQFPDSASLLYGAPGGTATLTMGDTVTTSCEFPDYCDSCVCPADFINAETPVVITSTVPCGGGTASYSGPWGDAAFACEYTDPETDVVYSGDVQFGVYCCEAECNEEGQCVNKVGVTASGVHFDPDIGATSANYESECTEVSINVESGVVTGTVTIPWGEYSVTVAFGG